MSKTNKAQVVYKDGIISVSPSNKKNVGQYNHYYEDRKKHMLKEYAPMSEGYEVNQDRYERKSNDKSRDARKLENSYYKKFNDKKYNNKELEL